MAGRFVDLPARLVGRDLGQSAFSIDLGGDQDGGANRAVADAGPYPRGASGIVPNSVSEPCGDNCFGCLLRILDRHPRIRVALCLERPPVLLHFDHVHQNPMDRANAGFRTHDAVRHRLSLGKARIRPTAPNSPAEIDRRPRGNR